MPLSPASSLSRTGSLARKQTAAPVLVASLSPLLVACLSPDPCRLTSEDKAQQTPSRVPAKRSGAILLQGYPQSSDGVFASLLLRSLFPHLCLYSMKYLIAALVAVCLSVAHAEVDPVWSAAVVETIDIAQLRGAGVVGFAGDQGLMVAGDEVQTGLAVIVAMELDKAPTITQLGEPRRDAATRFDAVLASSVEGLLVAGVERVGTVNERAFSAAIGADGQMLWALPGRVDHALLLSDDRVLLAASAVLTMRRFSTGQTLWMRNLLELDSVAVDGRVQLAHTAVEPLLVTYRSRLEAAAPFRRPRLLALDPVTGETMRDLSSISGLSLQDTPFGIGELAGDLVVPWTVSDASGNPGLLIERRDPVSGAVRWATELTNLSASGRQTRLVADPMSVHLVAHSGAQAELLSFESQTGGLQFRQSRVALSPPALFGAEGGDLVLARLDSGSAVIERLLAATGQVIWQTPWLTDGAHALAIASQGQTLELVAAVHEGPLLAFKHATLDQITGALLDERSEVPWLRRAALGASAVIADQPYLAVSELGVDKDAIELRRFQAETGALLATTHLQLSESPEFVDRLRILDGGADDVLVEVAYALPGGTARRTVVLFRIDATGTIVHALQVAANQYHLPRLVASPDGGFSWSYASCALPECTLVFALISRHDRLGNELWRDTQHADLLTVIGSDTFYSDYSDEEVQLRTHTGDISWRSPRVGNFGPFHTRALGTDSVVMASTETLPAPLPGRRLLIQNFDLASGSDLWADILTIDDDTYVAGPHLWTSETDQRLWVSGSVYPAPTDGSYLVSPFLASYDPDSGQRLQFQTLARGADASWSFQEAVLQQGGWFWRRADRNLQSTADALSRRRVLTRIDPADGSIAAEHLLYRDFDPAVSGKGTLRILDVAANGDTYFERRAIGEGLIRRIALERLPAPSLTSGDVQIELVDAAPLTGLGPSRPVRLRVSNFGSVLAMVHVSGQAPDSAVGVLFTRCETAAGVVSCPLPVSHDVLTLQLAPGSVAELTAEVWPAHFQPQSLTASSTVVFVADLPFASGDPDLGNNLTSVEVRLGGFGDSFE